MKTLEEYNKQKFKEYTRANTYPQLNGIACPKCGKELYDADHVLLASYPPQHEVVCLNKECNFKGYRTA